VIFISKKLRFLSPFHLKQVYFLCFSVYRFVFVVSLFLTIQSLLYAEKVEEDTKATIFISFSSQTGLFSLFLCLQFHFCCFFVSLSTGSFLLFLCFSQYKSLNFLVFLSLLQCPHSFLYPPFYAFILFSDFSQYKSLNFFSDFSQYNLYCMQKLEEDTKAAIFISKKLRFLSHFQVKQVCFLFLCLHVRFFCFFVSLFLTIQKLKFFCVPQPSPMSSFFPMPLFCFLTSHNTKA